MNFQFFFWTSYNWHLNETPELNLALSLDSTDL
ncbi:rCG28524 [Rattus norvegicus]|uniref:RCG28524 n=1 Tax=Rattus norvegicus TaxID=10116 RepID=A6HWJ7_RAT|nr:rCG28524 [Rattus norvegicus]